MAISQFILDAKEQARQEVRLRNLWIVRARWFYLVLLTGVIAIVAATVEDTNSYRTFSLSLGLAGLVGNGLLWLVLRLKNREIRFYKIVGVFQILLDLWLASNVVYFQEGLDSRATALFAIPILTAGLMFTKFFAYFTAGWSGFSYATTILTYRRDNPGAYELEDTIVPITFYTFVFLVIAYIVTKYSNKNAMEQRQRSYEELLSMLRHQLRNPTSVIAGLVEMVEFGDSFAKLSVKDQGYLSQIKFENQRLNTMISNLLQVASPKTDSPESHKLELVSLLTQIATTAADSHKRADDLKLELPTDELTIQTSSDVRLALENILDNAFRYSTEGHRVTVVAKGHTAAVTIEVHNEGAGLTKKQLQALRHYFTVLDEGGEPASNAEYSTGLGLYVSKLIAERQDGKFEIESEPNKWTKVIIRLTQKGNDES